jgi:hypothetical protein
LEKVRELRELKVEVLNSGNLGTFTHQHIGILAAIPDTNVNPLQQPVSRNNVPSVRLLGTPREKTRIASVIDAVIAQETSNGK